MILSRSIDALYCDLPLADQPQRHLNDTTIEQIAGIHEINFYRIFSDIVPALLMRHKIIERLCTFDPPPVFITGGYVRSAHRWDGDVPPMSNGANVLEFRQVDYSGIFTPRRIEEQKIEGRTCCRGRRLGCFGYGMPGDIGQRLISQDGK